MLKIRGKTGAKNGTVVFPVHRFSQCLSRNLSAIPNYQNRINIFNALLFCRFRIRISIFRKRKLIRLPHSFGMRIEKIIFRNRFADSKFSPHVFCIRNGHRIPERSKISYRNLFQATLYESPFYLFFLILFFHFFSPKILNEIFESRHS